jgi:hypothetical protein
MGPVPLIDFVTELSNAETRSRTTCIVSARLDQPDPDDLVRFVSAFGGHFLGMSGAPDDLDFEVGPGLCNSTNGPGACRSRFVQCRATRHPASGRALLMTGPSPGALDTLSTSRRQEVGYGRGELEVVRHAG